MDDKYTFFLSGDLNQMSVQRSFLNSCGIKTEQNNVYPCLKKCDVKEALTLLWKNRVDGWWCYKDNYVYYKICTKQEFLTRLKY